MFEDYKEMYATYNSAKHLENGSYLELKQRLQEYNELIIERDSQHKIAAGKRLRTSWLITTSLLFVFFIIIFVPRVIIGFFTLLIISGMISAFFIFVFLSEFCLVLECGGLYVHFFNCFNFNYIYRIKIRFPHKFSV